MLTNTNNLNYYESVWTLVHGVDPSAPFSNIQQYVEACAPNGYESAVDAALSTISSHHAELARSYFGTGLSYLGVARLHNVSKGDVNYAVRAAMRAFEENSLAISLGPEMAKRQDERLLPISMLRLTRESHMALRLRGINGIRDLLMIDPETLVNIPRISIVRAREIRTAMRKFLEGDLGKDVKGAEAWRERLDAWK